MARIVYHRLISRDLRSAINYYESEAGTALANRFFDEVEDTLRDILKNPTGNHFSDGGLRRAALKTFPYHFLYEIESDILWIAVLRHDRRHPSFGLSRQKPSSN